MSVAFISHSSQDGELAKVISEWCQGRGYEAFLDFDRHTGIGAGEEWERRLYREISRCHAFIVVITPNWHESKWCFAELTQARALGKPIFPLVFSKAGQMQVLPHLQAVDLTVDMKQGFAELDKRLKAISFDAQRHFQWDKDRPPYPGLMSFEEPDAAIYYGRDDDINRVVEDLHAMRTKGTTRLAALLGASGTGKSSLLRAGVLPRLKRLAGNWIVLPPFRPVDDPLEGLAQAIASHLRKDGPWLEGHLAAWRKGELVDSIKSVVRELRAHAGANEADILITIDQAEELFTLCSPQEARLFLAFLSALLGGSLPFFCIASIRVDFLGNLLEAPGLAVPFHQIPLKPVAIERIGQIVEGPARVVGLNVETGLVQTIIRDAVTEDALPLLAFALREMYQNRSSHGELKIADYDRLGDRDAQLSPLENAVRRRADQVLASAAPDPEGLAALRAAFIPGLVSVNDEDQYVRQPARWSSLPPRAIPIIEELVKARLLVVRDKREGEDGGEGERMVEVAHEALIRKWPTLRKWLGEEIEFLRGKRNLANALRDWQQAEVLRRPSTLWTGLNLDRAEEWLVRHPHGIDTDERAFIGASLQARDEARQREEAQRRRIEESELSVARAAREKAEGEAEAATRIAKASQRVVRRTRIGLAATSVMLVVAAVAAVVAEQQRNQAVEAKTMAEEARTKTEEARALAELFHLRAVRNSLVSKNTDSRAQAATAEAKRIETEFKGYVDTTLSFISGLPASKQGGAFQDLMAWAESEKNAAGRSHGHAGTNAVTNQFEVLIRRTESMDDEERKDWFNKLPIMSIGQRARLMQILFVEREKLAALESKYQGEIKQLNRGHLSQWREVAGKQLGRQAAGYRKVADANAKLWESGTKMAAIQAQIALVRNTPEARDGALILSEAAEELKGWLREASIRCGDHNTEKDVSNAACTLDDRRLEIAEKFDIKEKHWRLLVVRAQRREAEGLIPQAAADLNKSMALTEEIAAGDPSARNFQNVALVAAELFSIVELLENARERGNFPSYQELVLKRFNALVRAKDALQATAAAPAAKGAAANGTATQGSKESDGSDPAKVLETLDSLIGDKKADSGKGAEILNTIVWQAATDPVFNHYAPRDKIAQLAEELRKITTNELVA